MIADGSLLRRLPWILSLVLMLLALRAPVNYHSCDPWGSLATSQAIANNGTLRLDAYPQYTNEAGYRVRTIDGGQYYYFPPGPSVLAAPLVWAVQGLDLQPKRARDDRLMQRVLAALLFAAVFLVLCRVFAAAFSPLIAILLALLFALGTGVASTVALAYWSHGPALLLLLAALVIVMRADLDWRRAFLAGFLAGIAVWCRPTALLGVIAIGLLPPRISRRTLAAYGGGALVAGLGLVALSLVSYGSVAPPYYLGGRLADLSGEAIAGSLVSPSRGLFILSPFLVPILGWGIWSLRSPERRRPVAIALVWFVLQLLVLGRFEHWWGGHCFGSRLMLDAIPAFVVLTVATGPDLVAAVKRPLPMLVAASVLLLAVPAIGTNTLKAFFVIETARWNSVPNIDRNPGRLWSWYDAQWRANHLRHVREIGAILGEPDRNAPVATVGADTESALFVGWMPLERGKREGEAWRWSKDKSASLVWTHGRIAGPDSLRVTLNSKWPLTAEVCLNGDLLGTVELAGWARRSVSFVVPDETWRRSAWRHHDPSATAVVTFRRPWLDRWLKPPAIGFWQAEFHDSDSPAGSR